MTGDSGFVPEHALRYERQRILPIPAVTPTPHSVHVTEYAFQLAAERGEEQVRLRRLILHRLTAASRQVVGA